MKVSYIIQIDPNKKTGLYNAVLSRINKDLEFSVFNINIFDSLLLSIMKKLLKKEVRYKHNNFIENNINVENICVERTLLSFLFSRLFKDRTQEKVYEIILGKLPNNVDLLIAHNGGAPTHIARMIAIKNSIKFINIFHGSDIHSTPNTNFVYKNNLIKDLNTSNANIFVSNGLLLTSIAIGNNNLNNFVIHNGIDTHNTNNTAVVRSKTFEGSTPFSIIYVGNLLHIKGVDFLPKIAHFVTSSIPSVRFIIVGEGPYLELLKNKMPSNTVFTGTISNSVVHSILGFIDMVILPSRNEGLPIILCEALVKGKSIVASNVGGISELIDDCFLVKPGPEFERRFADKIFTHHNNNTQPISKIDIDIDKVKEAELVVFKKILRHIPNGC